MECQISGQGLPSADLYPKNFCLYNCGINSFFQASINFSSRVFLDCGLLLGSNVTITLGKKVWPAVINKISVSNIAIEKSYQYRILVKEPLARLQSQHTGSHFRATTVAECLQELLGQQTDIDNVANLPADRILVQQQNMSDYELLQNICERFNLYFVTNYSASHANNINITKQFTNDATIALQLSDDSGLVKDAVHCWAMRILHVQTLWGIQAIVLLKTNALELYPGACVKIIGEENKIKYRLISIAHRWRYKVGYENHLLLFPVDVNMRELARAIFDHAYLLHSSLAIHKKTLYALAFKAKQTVTYHLHIYDQLLQRLPVLQQSNQLFQRLSNDANDTTVLCRTKCLNSLADNSFDACVVGTVNNTLQPSVVTSNNATQFLYKSKQQQLLFEQTAEPSIALMQAQQSLVMASGKQSSILLQNKAGAIEINAKHNINWKAIKNSLLQANKISAKASQHTFSSDSALSINCAKHIRLQTANLQLASDNELQVSSPEQVKLHAQKLYWDVANQNWHANVTGNVNIISKDSLKISAKKLLQLASKQAVINIQTKTCCLNAENINIKAQRICALGKFNLSSDISNKATKKHNVAKSKQSKQTKPHKLPPLIAINLRSDIANQYFKSQAIADDPYQRDMLNAEEIKYFKQNGNNICLFIHGYNVHYGEFGKSKLPGINSTDTCNQYIYRDPNLIELANLHPITAEKNLYNDAYKEYSRMNGSGAHSWWLHMEDNINRATGQFNRGDYDKYTRMCHIAWQGNPAKAWDYMAAVEQALQAAPKLQRVLSQCINAGLQVNIIAHSLGCLVASKAVDLLKQQGMAANCINQLILWEAALPNLALSATHKDKSEFGNYQTPNVMEMVKNTIVLHSCYDNVLGPVKPETNAWQWLKLLTAKQINPAGGAAFVALAVGLKLLDRSIETRPFQSVYHLANILGKPVTWYLQSAARRQQFYQHWIVRYYDINERPFQSDISSQVRDYQLRYPDIMNYLSTVALFISGRANNSIHALIRSRARDELNHPNKVSKFIASFNKPVARIYPKTNYLVKDRAANELAAILITAMLSRGYDPLPALGYSGPDWGDASLAAARSNGKLLAIDQSDCLYTHSAMKDPDAYLFEKIYRQALWEENTHFNFGSYR